jgi:hypothetical protein
MSPAADVEVPKEIQGFMTRSRNVTSGPFHLSCRSLHQAVSDLHAMVHLPEVFFPDEVEDKIYFVSADSRKVEDCALLQQIRLVENLAEGVLRRYHAAPCFQTMLVSCVTELEFSMGVVNRVFQDQYLARYILEYAYALPKINRSLTTRVFDEHRRYLENTFCVRMRTFYDYCQSMFVSYNRPPEQLQQEHEEEDGKEGQELANKRKYRRRHKMAMAASCENQEEAAAGRGARKRIYEWQRQQLKNSIKKNYKNACDHRNTKRTGKCLKLQPFAKRKPMKGIRMTRRR